MENILWYRKLYRDCIRYSESRAGKLLQLASLRQVQADIRYLRTVDALINTALTVPERAHYERIAKDIRQKYTSVVLR
jgi:hypothetical protein